MDLSTVLGRHLHDLVDGLGTDDGILTDAMAVLVGDLGAAVSSYLGLRLSLVLDGWPVTLSAFPPLDGGRPVTSLRLALSGLDRGFDAASHVVFYAGTPGAFVDLAADFAYLHGQGWGRDPTGLPVAMDDPAAGDGHRALVVLDVDLPPPTVVAGFTGLAEYAAINRALGVLLERGHPPDQARAALHHGASVAGMDLPGYAAGLLVD